MLTGHYKRFNIAFATFVSVGALTYDVASSVFLPLIICQTMLLYSIVWSD